MGGRGRKCLPKHLRDKRHDDWLWPFSYIFRGWNAFCGLGPSDADYKPIPKPGRSIWTWMDSNGSWWRPYYAHTFCLRNFRNGRYLHFRIGFRWDDVDFYYNLVVPFNLSWEPFEEESCSDGD